MLRSTSHIGGIGVSERGSVDMPSTPQSAAPVEEKKLHLMIDNKYEMLRSTSHIGGIGVSERGSVDMPSTPQSAAPVEEKKLHLMIDNKSSRTRTISCSPVPDGSMSAGTNVSHPEFALSQPSSPIIDDSTHPQLVPSPCIGTPRSSNATLLNRTISDESANSSNRWAEPRSCFY
ncbi:hypothetical protein OESDEN_05466 [Oesophagostomum dentatum]|uniref:Uncharacterized protein n=1 Tax=Oesophagostomum dentatum TaxID=61180 RepID=A0A0B1TET0_OESDE|nr:hypothetical protein OESDEN_05466 [Oesophagostomum dentatum]